MTFAVRPFLLKPQRMNGLSERLLVSHYENNYGGALNRLNAITEELEALAAQKGSREEIEREALRGGMRTMWDDGLSKVAAGLTSVEELARVVSV